MNKLALSSLALSSVLLSYTALAQTPAAPAVPPGQEAAPQTGAPAAVEPAPATVTAEAAPEKKITAGGLVQAYFGLFNSTEDGFPLSLPAGLARFKLNATEGIFNAGFEVEFFGNTVANTKSLADARTKAEANAPFKSKNAFINTNNNSVGVRRADVGLKFPFGTEVKVGRYRPGGADGWGVDSSGTTDAFGPNEGLYLSHNQKFGESSVGVGFGVANALATGPVGGAYWPRLKSGAPTFLGGNPDKTDRAFISNLTAEIDALGAGKVAAKVYYGWENNAIAGTDGVDTIRLMADQDRLEASLGFNADNYGAGVWYSRASKGKTFAATQDGSIFKKAGLATGDDASDASASTLIGVGTNVDSGLIGLTSMLQRDDKLTFGVSYDLSQERDDATSDSDEKKNDTHGVSTGVGYAGGSFSTELNYRYQFSDAEQFKDGAAKNTDNRSYVYLVTTYAL